nr:hypothetical protein Iba_chr01bCG10150 [Ipomoea batatas]
MNSFLVELNVAANGRTSAFKRHGCNCVRQHLISNLEQGLFDTMELELAFSSETSIELVMSLREHSSCPDDSLIVLPPLSSDGGPFEIEEPSLCFVCIGFVARGSSVFCIFRPGIRFGELQYALEYAVEPASASCITVFIVGEDFFM